jgi:hypothetical protein
MALDWGLACRNRKRARVYITLGRGWRPALHSGGGCSGGGQLWCIFPLRSHRRQHNKKGPGLRVRPRPYTVGAFMGDSYVGTRHLPPPPKQPLYNLPGARRTTRANSSSANKAGAPKNRFQNVAYTSNSLERTLGPNKYTASGAADDRLCMSGGDRRQGVGVMAARYLLHSNRSSAELSSVHAFERITSAASSRESPPMSVSHTSASMPSVAPIA